MLIQAKKNTIGIDISNGSIKMAEMFKNKDKIGIKALGKIFLPGNAVNDGLIADQEIVIKKLKEMLLSPFLGKFTSDECSFSLPDSVSFIKLIEIEKTASKIENAIKEEITKHVPFDINDLAYDWQIIKDPGLQKDTESVLFGACRKQILDEYIDTLSRAGFKIAGAEIESQAICRSLLAEESSRFKGVFDKNYAIIDIGMEKTNMAVYSHNCILFSLDVPISGSEITEKISKTLNLSEDQAEKAKIICGLDENKADGIIMNILSENINELKNKIDENINYYNCHFPERGQINSILLCGGGANIKNIDKLIKDFTKIETNIADVFINCEMVSSKDRQQLIETHRIDLSADKKPIADGGLKNSNVFTSTQNSSSSFAAAVGLSLRGLFLNEY
jgi:type IV pilus assembly protein PilM